MWQSTISLRYVSYKNADSNLHKRIGAMAMMAKNLLWSCAPIVAPRPPINPQRPNQAMERTPKAFGVAHLVPVRPDPERTLMRTPDLLYLALIQILLLLDYFLLWPAFLRRSQANPGRAR